MGLTLHWIQSGFLKSEFKNQKSQIQMTPIPPVMLRYIDALKAHDVAEVAATVAEEVSFVSGTRTLDKRQFLALLTALYAAFPDWHYDHDAPEMLGDGSIQIKWRQGGTHTGSLALPGLPSVAPTGKAVRIPEQFFRYKVAGGRIIEIRPDPIAGGAPRGIFEQIGAANLLL
jgi:predicted ester cyclase